MVISPIRDHFVAKLIQLFRHGLGIFQNLFLVNPEMGLLGLL